MNKLYKILEITKIINDYELTYFKDVDVNCSSKDNNYFFNVKTNNVIPYEIFQKVQKFKSEDLNFNVNFDFQGEINNDIVNDILEEISKQFSDKKLFFKNISKRKATIDNQILNFYYFLDEEKKEIDSLYQNIVSTFKNYLGIEILAFQYFQDEEIIKYQNQLKEIENRKKELAIKESNEKKEHSQKQKTLSASLGKSIGKKVKLSDLEFEQQNIIVSGQIYKISYEERTKYWMHKIYISDYESTFLIKTLYFPDENKKIKNQYLKDQLSELQVGDWIEALVDAKTDKYETEIYGLLKKFNKFPTPTKYLIQDTAENKRSELTIHTKMSAFDGIIDVEELFKTVSQFGHKAVAITDRYNVQFYPEVQKYSKKYNIKPIYGCEFEVLPENVNLALNTTNDNLNDLTYVVFDLETTGLYPEFDDIIEFGAIKYRNNQIIDKIDFFIKPNQPLTDFTQDLTGIREKDVENAISAREGIVQIMSWIGNATLIAHNAIDFDFNFIVKKCEQYNLDIPTNPVIDTLHISRALFPEYKSHTLGKMCAKHGVDYDEIAAHRADYDAEVLFSLWLVLLKRMQQQGITTINDINSLSSHKLRAKYHSNFIYAYAKTPESLRNIYQLVSLSHTKNFNGRPLISYSNLDLHRQQLLLANSPIDGDLWHLALTATDEKLKQAINFYDYVFVAPPSCYEYLINESNNITIRDIEKTLKKIINFAISLNKKVVAVSDAHFLHKWDYKYYETYLYIKQIGGGRHRYYRQRKAPMTYVRNTDEMLHEFTFLNDNQLMEDIVINNVNDFIDHIGSDIYPIKDKLYTPHIDNVENLITEHVYQKAHEIYGDILPEIVEKRLKKELDSIIGNGYGVVYWISHLLVKKSLDDGYVVGSRGSVGSSLVATMLEITDVNPLPAHYYCKKCKYNEFVDNVDDGYDLDSKKCPQCNEDLIGEGHNIPFETFLGFKGEKVPDIDLNFSGEYQAQAHNFIKEMFGEDHAFRAGTISTVAEKTAYGYVKGYFEEINKLNAKNSEIDLYVEKCKDVKRTTGQHPGGILIVPKEYSIYDFSPFNYPADDTESTWYTTHFAFEYIHDNLLKFDILGHDNPTILRQLKQLTNVDMYDIPNNDKNVIKLFTSPEPLNIIDNKCLNELNGAISLPEFGTKFVREMLNNTQPSSFSDLIRISGLSHGTDVYVGNAKSLIKNMNLKLENVIACRDDIMNYLISQGIDNSISFKIMEDVRKGRGLKQEYEEIMIKHNVPQWYIDSCNKIKYIFPKAHATAYVQHAYKFAWYKIYYPLPYYATYFSNKTDAIDIATLVKGRDEIKLKMKEIEKKVNDNVQTKKEDDLLVNFTVALEMISRGFKFYKPSIFKSDATKFIVLEDGLLAPFNSIDGVGETAALSVVDARNEAPFSSIDDLKKRTKLNTTNIQALQDIGSLEDLPESNQMSLF